MTARHRSLACATTGGCADDAAMGAVPTPEPADMHQMASDDQPLAINGCNATSYAAADHTDATDPRVIQIAIDGLVFTPPCITIAAGQSVRFEGSLTAHPLAPGTPDDAQAGSPESPIERTSSGNSAEFTFEHPGTFPYYCELHGFGSGSGMVGAVYVR